MKTIHQKLLNFRGKRVLAFLVLSTLVVPSALAKAKSEAPTQKASVIAHLPLPGTPVSQVLLRQQGSKEYLYIQQTARESFTVIDVTQPEHPSVVKTVTLTDKSGDEKLEMVGNGLALAETPDSSSTGGAVHELAPAKPQAASGTATPAPPTESIRVLDLSDPKNPKTLQTFNGVTKVLAEDDRNLIYITNGEGLWILRHNPNNQNNQESRKRSLPPCDSESVFSPIVDCQ
jgi:hypothetical protein